MSDTEELLPWLRAQIAETAEIAKKAYSRINPGEDRWVASGMQVRDGRGHLIVKHSWPAEIDHIVRNDPRTALAQCEAHTAILDAHPCMTDEDDEDDQECGVCVQPGGIGCNEWPEDWRTQPWPCPTVRAVGLAYQHCPGYRPEWKP